MSAYTAIAFITARKNSKRLPGKNKKLLNGKPLFRYTVDAALCSSCYKTVVLSTDDEDILEMAGGIQGLTVVRRPSDLAGDDVRAKDVVIHHLGLIKEEYDYVSLLMPTSPLRDAQDIKDSFGLLVASGADSLVSVTEYGFHPELALGIRGGRLYSYFHDTIRWVRDSEFEKAYHQNGAIFTARKEIFLKTKSFIHDGSVPFLMSKAKSADIDTQTDFAYAEFLLGGGLV